MSFLSKITVNLKRVKRALYFLKKNYWNPQTDRYGAMGEGSYISLPATIDYSPNIYLGKNVRIKPHCVLLTVGEGKLIMGNDIDVAVGLTVVSSNHRQKPGVVRDGSNDDNDYTDVVVEDDVWIGANVTLLAGSHVGRGAIIGAGCVVRRQHIPPYSVVIGNPAKVIRFKFTPEEIIEHEKAVYPEDKRLLEDIIRKNYEEFFLTKRDEIKKYRSLNSF